MCAFTLDVREYTTCEVSWAIPLMLLLLLCPCASLLMRHRPSQAVECLCSTIGGAPLLEQSTAVRNYRYKGHLLSLMNINRAPYYHYLIQQYVCAALMFNKAQVHYALQSPIKERSRNVTHPKMPLEWSG